MADYCVRGNLGQCADVLVVYECGDAVDVNRISTRRDVGEHIDHSIAINKVVQE